MFILSNNGMVSLLNVSGVSTMDIRPYNRQPMNRKKTKHNSLIFLKLFILYLQLYFRTINLKVQI